MKRVCREDYLGFDARRDPNEPASLPYSRWVYRGGSHYSPASDVLAAHKHGLNRCCLFTNRDSLSPRFVRGKR